MGCVRATHPEANFCQELGEHEEIEVWGWNVGLGYTIPYTDLHTGRERDYAPYFVAQLTPHGSPGLTRLILEAEGTVDGAPE